MPILDDPCALLPPTAKAACENKLPSPTAPPPGGSPEDPSKSLDPLTSLAHSMAKAAQWVGHELGRLISDPGAVDMTNKSFIQQYAVVFAASTVLVLVLWLLAVAKRAAKGVPMTTALGEAVSYLWLAVCATAFTPLILYVVIGATNAVTTALANALGTSPQGLFDSVGDDLVAGKVGGGSLMVLIVSLVSVVLFGGLWLVLVIRALAIYVGAIFSAVIYAGLVDRDWWGHVRRWAGVMLALIFVQPIIVITFGLASALETEPGKNNVTTGLAISAIALALAVWMISRVPAAGDSFRVARGMAKGTAAAARVTARTTSAATGVLSGMAAHGDRSPGRSNTIGTQKAPNNVSGGMAAHSNRAPKKPKD
ncbi:hypothetical protein [Streptomyces sp. NPDC089919]|uniref:hypothetical protein n=1 Tax=Streptomyces sp. NPDC089919 TaxID=3155188 RepID=UPI00344AA60F